MYVGGKAFIFFIFFQIYALFQMHQTGPLAIKNKRDTKQNLKMDCDGCETLACCLKIRSITQIPEDSEVVET